MQEPTTLAEEAQKTDERPPEGVLRALSFIGLGAQPPTASWGAMLSRSAQFLTVSPSVQIYAPGLAITLTVLAINALGDSLRDSLDPVAGTQRRTRRILARLAKTEKRG